MNPKAICETRRCGWRGDWSDVLTAPNPFDQDDTLTGCPKCLQPNSIVQACSEPECWRPANAGTPTDEGYRWTCGEHIPQRKAS